MPNASIEINANHTVRDVTIGAIAIVLSAAILAFANIPTRTSVLENRVDTIEKHLDSKLDMVVARLPR